MPTVSLDPEAIEQLSGERKTLLDAIDNLRKHGIGRFVDLPQIIVVGDQSSGKSSVLEAISRFRFPMKNELCTRFPIELVLRTDPQTKVHMQAQPGSASTDAAHTFDETGFDEEDLPRIIEDAKTRMLQDGATFSEDVLSVEICSPDVPHLTLVDLPGFYHSLNKDQSADGREVVDRLVKSYMARKNSIILAIVSARSQAVMQKVLNEVKEHDKNQERTLGIITKPDLLIPDSRDEDEFIKLARNQDHSHQLAFGWHVLRNRGESETSLTPKERDSKEAAFFDSGIWSAIPSNNRGVATLRKKLASILLDHVRKNLDTLIKDIQEKMDLRKKTLERLGPPRSSPPQLRAHLDKIASQFQLLSLRAIEGHYSDEFFGGLYPDYLSASVDDSRIRKLRALIRDLNRTFAYVLATKGSRRIILPERTDGGQDHKNPESQETSLPSFLRALETQYPFDNPEEVTRSAIRAELEPLSSANQGTEFPGTTNDLLAVKLFQDQSRPWEAIARFHIDFLLRIVKSFAEKLVTYITGPDEKTCSAILLNIVDPFFEKCTLKLERKLQELLYHFRSGYPQPSDAEFRAILARRHQNYLTPKLLQNLLASRPELFTESGKRQLTTELFPPGQKGEFGVDRLINKSETYYELSLRNFTDNVIILAIENCLIKDLPTIFTTSVVSQMEDDMLERLATESTDIQVERAELIVECEALQKGLEICKTYRGRNTTVLPAIPLRPKDYPSISVQSPNVSETFASPSGGNIHMPSQTPSSGTTPSANAKGSGLPSPGTLFPASGIASNGISSASSKFGASTSANSNQNTAPSSGLFGSANRVSSSLFGASTTTTTTTNPTTGSSPFSFAKNPLANQNSVPTASLFGTSSRVTTDQNTAANKNNATGTNPFGNLTSTATNKKPTSGLFGTGGNNVSSLGSQ